MAAASAATKRRRLHRYRRHHCKVLLIYQFSSVCHSLFLRSISLIDVPARELFAAAVVSGADEGGRELVVLHGGHCTDALLQTVTALDAHSLEVVYTEDAPEARVAHAGVWVGGRSVLMYGGTNMLHPPAYDDCLMFDAGSKQW
jgi:hypothetical protein